MGGLWSKKEEDKEGADAGRRREGKAVKVINPYVLKKTGYVGETHA